VRSRAFGTTKAPILLKSLHDSQSALFCRNCPGGVSSDLQGLE
jgi:hypothetical protein